MIMVIMRVGYAWYTSSSCPLPPARAPSSSSSCARRRRCSWWFLFPFGFALVMLRRKAAVLLPRALVSSLGLAIAMVGGIGGLRDAGTEHAGDASSAGAVSRGPGASGLVGSGSWYLGASLAPVTLLVLLAAGRLLPLVVSPRVSGSQATAKGVLVWWVALVIVQGQVHEDRLRARGSHCARHHSSRGLSRSRNTTGTSLFRSPEEHVEKI
mmetsp:Transcript_19548/g.39601  ORF Transcript_19548/g.39601 Transcript_19548/m.39601 type:complete len:211 (+) Transcript_19548:304-936(+)